MKPVLLALALSLLATTATGAADERSWNFREDEEGASLSFAIPDSDDAGPTFYCQRGEGQVGVLFFVDKRFAVGEPRANDGAWLNAKGRPAPWPGTLTITSGRTVARIKGTVVNDEMTGGSMIEVKLHPNAPVLSAFAASGDIRLTAFGESSNAPRAPAARVRTLLEACRK